MHSTRSCSGWNSSTIESCFKLRPSFKTETQFKLTKWCLLQSLWWVLISSSGQSLDSAQNHFYLLAFLSRTSNWGLKGGFFGHNCSMEYKWNIFPFNYDCHRFLDICIFGYQTPPAVGFLCGNWWIEWLGGNICRGPHTCQHFTIYSCAFSSDGTNILLFDGTRANILRISMQGGGILWSSATLPLLG